MNTSRNDRVFLNAAIRASQMICIRSDTNQNLGLLNKSEALKIASELGMDLLEVNAPVGNKPSICKFLDYGKFRYEESKKKKASDKKQRESMIQVHEIKFKSTTDPNDLLIKARKTKEFLEQGGQVRITILFRSKSELSNRREAALREVAVQTLKLFLSYLPEAEVQHTVNQDFKTISTLLVKRKK